MLKQAVNIIPKSALKDMEIYCCVMESLSIVGSKVGLLTGFKNVRALSFLLSNSLTFSKGYKMTTVLVFLSLGGNVQSKEEPSLLVFVLYQGRECFP